MTSAPIITEDTTVDQHDTSVKIQSKRLLQVTRIAFVGFLFFAILFSIQLFSASLEYYRGQSALIESEFLASLYPGLITLVRTLVKVAFIGVGILIFVRKGNDRIGLLTGFFMIAFGTAGVWHAQYTADPTAYIEANNFGGAFLYSAIGWLLILVFLYVFPDGRFAPRWMFIPLLASFSLIIFWGIPSSSPLYAGNWQGLLFLVVHGSALLSPLASQIYRYRKVSTPVQRQQTKWVLYALTCMIVATLGVTLFPALFPDTFQRGTIAYDVMSLASDVPFILIPIALAFAILRSGLWDIDLIINRSLAYGVVIIIAILSFFGAMVGLQLAVGQTQPVVALLIAGAFSAVIFNPLRSRVQHFVDRHIYHFRFGIDTIRDANKTPEIQHAGALSGKTLGDYQVLDVIGKGGMGEVYRATNGTQTVAVKVLLTDQAENPEILKRFQREAEAGQTLNHPNIARVHSIQQESGMSYIVMDYLEGEDLSSWLKANQQMDIPMAHEIMRDVTSALDYAHGKGFVHRDIKPSNIMLVLNADQETYRAILMDFGITKIQDANTLTGTGAIGTIDYMAPEQIMDARTVDHRADIYALGILMYELLIGERPFKGGPAQIMFAHIQQPAPDPRDAMPDMPRPIARAIMKAMEKSPDDRFDSALDLSSVFV